MPGETAIEWTRGDDGSAGATWNPVTGCTKVSAGCDHCYAERFAERFRGVAGHPYEQGFDLRLWPERLAIPLGWRKPKRIFVNSMADLWHASVPDRFIDDVFVIMEKCPQHTFMVLTKRPQRMYRYLADANERGEAGRFPFPVLPNVWLGVSVENQEAAYRVDWLARTPARVRFLSCEPLIGALDLTPWLFPANIGQEDPEGPFTAAPGRPRVDWVIAGGESGPGARPMHPDWARDLRDQSTLARVPFFFKQWGEWAPAFPRSEGDARSRVGAAWEDGAWQVFSRGDRHGDVFRVGKHRAGRELDGRTWDEFPEAVAG